MDDWKLILGVVGGSLLLIGLAVFGFEKMGSDQNEEQGVEVNKLLEGARWIKGEEDSKVTVVEFSDLQCPACKRAEVVVNQIENLDGVRLVYRHFPLFSIHKNALGAAVAVEAAGKQGRFWEYKDVLYEKQEEWAEVSNTEDKFFEFARDLGMDEDKFLDQMKKGGLDDLVKSDYQLGARLGVSVTPTFYVNGEKVEVSKLVSEVREQLRE